MKKIKKGFTLVELVIVIAVIAILAAVLIPTFAGILERARNSSNRQQAVNEFHDVMSASETTLPEEWPGSIVMLNDKYYMVNENLVLEEIPDEDVAIVNGKLTITLSDSSVVRYMAISLPAGTNAYSIAMFREIPDGISYVNESGKVVSINSGLSYMVDEELVYVDFDNGADIEDYLVIDANNMLTGFVSPVTVSNIIEISIPAVVEELKASLFSGSSVVTVLFEPGSAITKIGNSCFYNCFYLEEIELPEGLVEIGSSCFNYNRGFYWWDFPILSSVLFPSTLTTIGASAFENAAGLASVIFAEGSQITTIGANAFLQCVRLVALDLPNRDINIGNGAFTYCLHLANCTWEGHEANLTNSNIFPVGRSRFYNVDGVLATIHDNDLITISLPEEDGTNIYLAGKKHKKHSANTVITEEMITSTGANKIASQAFIWCKDVTEVYLPDTITSIGVQAFTLCYNLKRINIPAYVETIGVQTFYDCVHLTTVEFSENSHLKYIGSGGVFCGTLVLEHLVLPEGLLKIDDRAFDCQDSACDTGLKTIVIPSTVKVLGHNIFNCCTNLTNVTFADGFAPERVGKNIFSGCTHITEFDCYTEVTNAGSNVVAKYLGSSANPHAILYSLTSSFNPSSDTIHDDTKAVANDAVSTSHAVLDDDGMYYIPSETNAHFLMVAPSDKTLTSYIVNDNTVLIHCGAFNGCNAIQTVTLPSGLRNLNEDTFYHCSTFTNVIVPNGVTFIGNSAFNGTGLNSIVVPTSVTHIDNRAFVNVTGVLTVYYMGTAEQWASIYIDSENSIFTNATRLYYSESYVAGGWHYDAGLPTAW